MIYRMISPIFTLPAICFVFGQAGAGKTFVGNILAEHGDGFAYDLDLDWTPEYRQAIAEKRLFTDDMRDRYFDVVCSRIGELSAKHPRLVVMQGMYKERHRERVKRAHPGIVLLHVKASPALITERLTKRGDEITADYALRMSRGFEEPSSGTALEIQNDRDEAWIVEQCRLLFPAK